MVVTTDGGGGVLLASNVRRLGMLLNIFQCTRQPFATKNKLVPDVNIFAVVWTAWNQGRTFPAEGLPKQRFRRRWKKCLVDEGRSQAAWQEGRVHADGILKLQISWV